MGVSRCRVSFTDMDGLHHAVEVEAETLYEAVALAVVEFRNEELIDTAPKIMTEFTVSVSRKPIEHRLCFNQLLKWAEPTTQNGPGEFRKRERVRQLLAPLQKPPSA